MTRDSVIYPAYGLYVHPQFVLLTGTNDIGLVNVLITLNANVQPGTVSASFLPAYSQGQDLSGWDPPQQNSVNTILLETCQGAYTLLSPAFVTSDHLCTLQPYEATNVPPVSATY